MKKLLVFICLISCILPVSGDISIAEMLKLWDYGNPELSRNRFMERVSQVTESGDRELLGALHTQIARSYSLRGDFKASHRELDKSLALIKNQESDAMALYLLERGRTYNSAGNKKEALALFTRSWEIARQTGYDYLAVDAAHMVAIAEALENQLKWNMKALLLAEASASEDAKVWLGALYNNIGWTYFNQGDYGNALNMFNKGLEFRRARGQTEKERIAQWTVGKTYRVMGRVNLALSIQQRLEKEMMLSGAKADGFVYEELAELYRLTGDARAATYFSLAHDILAKDDWLVANEPERLQRLKEKSQELEKTLDIVE